MQHGASVIKIFRRYLRPFSFSFPFSERTLAPLLIINEEDTRGHHHISKQKGFIDRKTAVERVQLLLIKFEKSIKHWKKIFEIYVYRV